MIASNLFLKIPFSSKIFLANTISILVILSFSPSFYRNCLENNASWSFHLARSQFSPSNELRFIDNFEFINESDVVSVESAPNTDKYAPIGRKHRSKLQRIFTDSLLDI